MAQQFNRPRDDNRGSQKQGSNFDNAPKVNPLKDRKADILMLNSIGKIEVNEKDDDQKVKVEKELELLRTLLDGIQKFAKDYGEKLSSSQLRNVFGKVKTAKTPMDIQLLRPKLMYVAARQKSKSDEQRIMEFLESVATDVKTDAEVKSFKIFMEAFVAYHKYHYPSEGK